LRITHLGWKHCNPGKPEGKPISGCSQALSVMEV
jgi:hypothetical protein